MEPISTTVGAGLIAYASKDLIAKLLGPSADYIGGELRGLVEKCNVNLGDIFTKAVRKSGDAIDDESQVSPRVVKAIVSEGSFCDDDTLKEYYAGILAASRTKSGDDDIGVSLLSVLQGLSVYQVRLHYLFYHEFHRSYSGKPVHLGEQKERTKRKLFIPYTTLIPSLKVAGQFEGIMVHAITGLIKNDLLGATWQFGSPDGIKKYYAEATQPGLILEPSLSGIELFVWANGKQRISPTAFLMSAPIDDAMDVTIATGTQPTNVDT